MKTPLIFFAVDYDVSATFYGRCYSFFPADGAASAYAAAAAPPPTEIFTLLV